MLGKSQLLPIAPPFFFSSPSLRLPGLGRCGRPHQWAPGSTPRWSTPGEVPKTQRNRDREVVEGIIYIYIVIYYIYV